MGRILRTKIWIVFIISIMVVSGTSTIYSQASTANNPTITVSPDLIGKGTLTSGWSSDVVALKNSTYIVYTSGHRAIIAISQDEGRHFSKDILQSSTTYDPKNIQVAVTGTYVFVTWVLNGEVELVNSSNDGLTWSSVANVGQGLQPNIAASENNVYLAFSYNEAIVFWSSLSRQEKSLSPSGFAQEQSISSYGNSIYVSWEQQNQSGANYPRWVDLAISTNGGMSFLIENLRSPSLFPLKEIEREPIVVAKPDHSVYVLWRTQDPGVRSEFWIAASNDSGSNFEMLNASSPSTLSREGEFYSAGNNTYVVYRSLINNSWDTYLALSDKYNMNFSNPIFLSPVSNISALPQEYYDPFVVASNNQAYVIYDTSTGMYLATIADGGISYYEIMSGSGLTGQVLTLNGNHLCAIWNSNSSIYFFETLV